MSKILFVGNVESSYIEEVLEKIISNGNQLIISAHSYQILTEVISHNEIIKNNIKKWSWNDRAADFHIGSKILSVFPYMYPDTVDQAKSEKILNVSQYSKKSYSSFRLGFGAQEELFDLFLAHIFCATEIVYFDLISSLQLLNPVNQLEYRKNSYEFLSFIEKQQLLISNQLFEVKKYKLAKTIPFYESFSEQFANSLFITHYVPSKQKVRSLKV